MILREKDFREFVKNEDWSKYKDKFVALTCTADAIVPTWAYMLLTLALEPFAKKIIFGNLNDLENLLFAEKLAQLPVSKYKDARIVIKGCGDLEVGPFAYLEITKLLRPIAKSIMYGEACSTVPIFKKGNNA